MSFFLNVARFQELVGLWVNGDPLRAVCCNGDWADQGPTGAFLGGRAEYLLVNIHIAIENGHRNSGFTHTKW